LGEGAADKMPEEGVSRGGKARKTKTFYSNNSRIKFKNIWKPPT
jgi:hypothetical protein